MNLLQNFILTCISFIKVNCDIPGTPPVARGPPLRRHNDIHLDINQERDHLKEHVKEAYLDTKDLNDDQLLMQYFKKHDSDNNMKLDGLELLDAIIRMNSGDHSHHEEDNQIQDNEWVLDEIVRIVDEILENDDKDKDGYINWSEFMMGQRDRNSV